MVCRSAEGELEEYKRRQAKLHVGQHHFIGPDCFDILTNRYRLVTAVDFEKGILWIKWIGTHKEYDKIDVKRVKHGRR
jgi:mRNA-degrading endonuclease HigB of HigAB toxin-antitoxin module